jgi:hypothetical protein
MPCLEREFPWFAATVVRPREADLYGSPMVRALLSTIDLAPSVRGHKPSTLAGNSSSMPLRGFAEIAQNSFRRLFAATFQALTRSLVHTPVSVSIRTSCRSLSKKSALPSQRMTDNGLKIVVIGLPSQHVLYAVSVRHQRRGIAWSPGSYSYCKFCIGGAFHSIYHL